MIGDAPPIDLLLVEDSPEDVAAVRRLTARSRVPVRLTVAAHAAEALALLSRPAGPSSLGASDPSPQVILLDIHLPGMDGLEVLRQIRSQPRLDQVPTILLSGSDDDRDVRAGLELGAHSHIVKPISPQSFDWIINSVRSYLPGIAELTGARVAQGTPSCSC